jgi:hypothetical protein
MSDIQFRVVVSFFSFSTDSFYKIFHSSVLKAFFTVVVQVSDGAWLMGPAVVGAVFFVEKTLFSLRECHDNVVGSGKVEVAIVSDAPVSPGIYGQVASMNVNMNLALFVSLDAAVWIVDKTKLVHTSV